MFQSILKWSLINLPRRYISGTTILPHEIDRFNAACVRQNDWPDDIQRVREKLTSKSMKIE